MQLPADPAAIHPGSPRTITDTGNALGLDDLTVDLGASQTHEHPTALLVNKAKPVTCSMSGQCEVTSVKPLNGRSTSRGSGACRATLRRVRPCAHEVDLYQPVVLPQEAATGDIPSNGSCTAPGPALSARRCGWFQNRV
ncbi:hypothetical protein OG259_41395 (plasmid) [Streptomyces sp. NBC_00250]|uniref:hypothetical protein n=1 Tax=Streptomyces sp. NBC_00250 TaxID=2903641 RepID=UPI002E2D4A55|nr:hypothetical protein [Streptomyces sp. NBC_00250]